MKYSRSYRLDDGKEEEIVIEHKTIVRLYAWHDGSNSSTFQLNNGAAQTFKTIDACFVHGDVFIFDPHDADVLNIVIVPLKYSGGD